MSKIAIVTGNAKGLGKAISERLSELGYKEPDTIRSADYDLCNLEACHKLIDDTINQYGHLDLLVNNVGNFLIRNISDTSPAEWRVMMDSNLNSAFHLSSKAMPYLRASRGRILNIGYAGLEALSPEPNVAAYEIAKTGLLSLTRAMAKAEASNGVLINMLSPGHLENTIPTDAMHKIPLGRLATLDEAVDTAFFLINSNYITGQNLELAGAWGL